MAASPGALAAGPVGPPAQSGWRLQQWRAALVPPLPAAWQRACYCLDRPLLRQLLLLRLGSCAIGCSAAARCWCCLLQMLRPPPGLALPAAYSRRQTPRESLHPVHAAAGLWPVPWQHELLQQLCAAGCAALPATCGACCCHPLPPQLCCAGACPPCAGVSAGAVCWLPGRGEGVAPPQGGGPPGRHLETEGQARETEGCACEPQVQE